MNLYKGYVKTKNKKAVQKFKDVPPELLLTLPQAQALPEYAGVLAEDTILVDFDDYDQSEVMLQMVKDMNLQCKVIKTTRGKHFLFRNAGVDKCYTHTHLACGLIADIKVGLKNSYEVLKFDGEERSVLYDIKDDSEYQHIPKWLTPVKTNTDFFGMKKGTGRNSALFGYEQPLQSAGFSIEECKEAIRLVNKYVFAEPMSDDELETVLRDEAFAKPTFFKDKTFLHNTFGDYLISKYHIVKIDDQLHLYQDGVYKRDHGDIDRMMVREIPQLKTTNKREVINYINAMCDIVTPATPNLIAFRNGIFDINTMTLNPFSPDCVITNKISWDYNPAAFDDDADKALNRISCNDPSIRSLLEECIGYCFFRQNTLQKAFILIGDKSNGKTTFLDVLNKILGDENISALSLKELDDRFSTASLFKKLANIGDDISDDFIPDSSIFKKIVSGSKIKAEEKGQPVFYFNPYVKLIFSANDMPRIRDKTGAVIRRLIIIPFNATFSEDNPDFDPDIKNKLEKPSAMEYFIKLGVEGLKRVLEQKHFTRSDKSEDELNEYKEFNNPIIGFFKDQDDDYIFRETTHTIYHAYDVWCCENGFNKESSNQFGRTVKALYGVESVRKTLNGKSIRMYVKMAK